MFLWFIWFFLVCAFVTWIKVNFTYLLTYSWTLCVGCGGQLRDVNGSFASPSYPGSVTTAFTCRWVIHVPARRNVNLRLNVYPRLSESGSSGGANTGCSSSYVQVWVDSSTQTIHQARLLGRYCTAVSLTLYGVDQKNGLRLMGLNRWKCVVAMMDASQWRMSKTLIFHYANIPTIFQSYIFQLVICPCRCQFLYFYFPVCPIVVVSLCSLYRAMHFSAKRGIAIACRLSVRPSVCDVGELWSHRLEFFENNFTVS